jgi:hypothetical protein
MKVDMKMLARLCLALLALFAAPALARPPAATAPAPALWRFGDADTTIWLFGTIHALPPGLDWKRGKVADAFASADRLIVEVVSPANPAELSGIVNRMALSPGLPPLAERLPAPERPALVALMARTASSPAAFKDMETWFAAMTLIAPIIRDIGVDPQSGADNRLMADARRRGIPVEGLETVEQQLGFFDTLPEDQQRAFLASIVAESEGAKAEFDKLVGAWTRGDVAQLALLADSDLKATPQMHARLLIGRNRAWAAALKRKLETPGTFMVAVGAAHLAGAGSVQAYLAKSGIKVRRVQ